jgi:hypothetical protein
MSEDCVSSIPVRFQSVIKPPWLGMEPIRIGNIPPGLGTPAIYVLVGTDERPILRIDRYWDVESGIGEDGFVWNDQVFIGLGDFVHVIGLPTQNVLEIPCTCFCYFKVLPDRVLFADMERLRCIGPNGTVQWTSEPIAIDTLTIDRISDGIIYGRGDWDPPGGHRPFRVSLTTGESV